MLLDEILEITADNLFRIVSMFIATVQQHGYKVSRTFSGLFAIRRDGDEVGHVEVQPHMSDTGRVKVYRAGTPGEGRITEADAEVMRKLAQHILTEVKPAASRAWKKSSTGKREKVFDDRLPVTRETLYQMVAEFARKAEQVWYDIDESTWRDFQVRWSQPDILTLSGRNARGTLVDLVDLAIQTGGNDYLCVAISGEVEIARSLRDDLLLRLERAETPQPAARGASSSSMTVENLFMPGSQQVNQSGEVNINSGDNTTVGGDIIGRDKKEGV